MRKLKFVLQSPQQDTNTKVRVFKRLAASVIATLAFTSVGANFKPTPAKANASTAPLTSSVASQNVIQPNTTASVLLTRPSTLTPLAQLQLKTTQPEKIQEAGLEGLIPIVVIGGLIIGVPLFFGGLVVIGEREVGI